MSTFAPCLAFTLLKEGGFVDNAADPGGATNLGITIHTLSEWREEDCTVEDVRDLTRLTVAPIYGAMFWNPVQGDHLPAGLDLMVFDHGVMAGPPTAARMLQLLVHAEPDGHIGPATIAAVGKMAPAPLIQALAAAQQAYYVGLHNPTFQKGWVNRVTARRDAALAMVRAHVPTLVRSPA